MSSELKVSPLLWRWATEGGEPREGTEQELVRQLASGQVPPYALVWRQGWGEWLPAMQVAELSAAFPGVAPVRTARPSSVPGSIPPVPVSEYPRLRLLAKETPLGLFNEFECPEREVITSEIPVAALLEAARAMTQPSPPADLGLDAAIQNAALQNVAGHDFAGHDFGLLRADPPGAEPGEPRFAAAESFWGERRRGPSRSAPPLAAELGLEDMLEAAARQGPKARVSAHAAWLVLAAAALGSAGLFGGRWLTASRAGDVAPSSSQSLQPLAPSAVESAREPLASVCRLDQEPVKLDNWAVVDVRPSLLPLPGSGAVALGYAQSHKHATGMRLDPATLSFERTFGQQNERQIYSVTPLAARGALGFHVERQGALVAFGRAIDAAPPLRVGMNDDGLVLGPLDQRSMKAWELPAGTLIAVPEVVAHSRGFTLALRAGRAQGHLRLGLLGPTGAPLSDLHQIGTAESEYGRPSLASGPDQTVLAVSSRSGAEGASRLMLGRARNGELPIELAPLEIEGALAAELTAPAVAALPDGSFAVIWTQAPSQAGPARASAPASAGPARASAPTQAGEAWRRQVRLLQLSPSLAPLGPVLDVSTPDPALGGATAGALFWSADRLLALYFARRDEGHSLWVAKVACGARAPL